MKVHREVEFMPVMVTLETQEEVDKFFSICNHSSLCDAVGLTGWYKKLKPFCTSNYNKYHAEISNITKEKME